MSLEFKLLEKIVSIFLTHVQYNYTKYPYSQLIEFTYYSFNRVTLRKDYLPYSLKKAPTPCESFLNYDIDGGDNSNHDLCRFYFPKLKKGSSLPSNYHIMFRLC